MNSQQVKALRDRVNRANRIADIEIRKRFDVRLPKGLAEAKKKIDAFWMANDAARRKALDPMRKAANKLCGDLLFAEKDDALKAVAAFEKTCQQRSDK